MMIHTIGDSHALCTFQGIPGVECHNRNGLTMKRVGHIEDVSLAEMLEPLDLTPADVVIFCLGEIDIRVFVKQYLEHHSTATLKGLVGGWVDAYLAAIAIQKINGAHIAVMSVIPPTREGIYRKYNTMKHKHNPTIPWNGTDEERVTYTREMNNALINGCHKRGWIYLDVYSEFADARGLLTYSDGSVHIGENVRVHELLKWEGLCAKS